MITPVPNYSYNSVHIGQWDETYRHAGLQPRRGAYDYCRLGLVDGDIAETPLPAKLLQLRHLLGAGLNLDPYVAVAREADTLGANPEGAPPEFLTVFAQPES